jgi:putative ABC transport system ATP-binding protein
VKRELTKVYSMGDQTVHALRGVSLTSRRRVRRHHGRVRIRQVHVDEHLGCLDLPTPANTAGREAVEGMQADSWRPCATGVSACVQQFNLLPRTSAIENVELPMVYSGIKAAVRRRRHGGPGQVGLGER